jgi:hypothetical protein
MMSQCLEVMKKDEFKNEFRKFMNPLISIILADLNPFLMYICLFNMFNTFLLVFILFLVFKK